MTRRWRSTGSRPPSVRTAAPSVSPIDEEYSGEAGARFACDEQLALLTGGTQEAGPAAPDSSAFLPPLPEAPAPAPRLSGGIVMLMVIDPAMYPILYPTA
jgi:hypothetical protein